MDVENSGVRVPLDGHALYTEIPGGPPPGILDGFMTSLLGLYDLQLETGDPVAGRLFEEGIAGSSTPCLAGTTPRGRAESRRKHYPALVRDGFHSNSGQDH